LHAQKENRSNDDSMMIFLLKVINLQRIIYHIVIGRLKLIQSNNKFPNHYKGPTALMGWSQGYSIFILIEYLHN